MNRKLWASAAAVALVAGTVTVVAAAPAEAHDYSLTADCQTGVQVSLKYYHDIIPAQDAKPAVYGPGSDETVHHDAIGTPTIPNPDYKPAVPGKDAVPTTYVQEYKYVQHITGNVKWLTDAHWNPGFGWTGPVDHRDTTTVLVKGTPAVPAQPAVGTPTIPNPAYKAAWDEKVHHDGALITPAVDAKDAQANHAKLTDNGAVLADKDFGTTLNLSFPNSDKTIAHDYVLTVSSLDGIGAGTWSKHIEACETPVTVVSGTPTITVTGPTCEHPYSLVNYDIPTGLSIAGYTGKGSVKAEDLNLGYGDKSFPVDVAAGYKYEGPATVSFTLVAPPTDAHCAPAKDVTINPVTQTQPTCEAGVTYTVPEQDAVVKYALDANGNRPTPGTYTLANGETVTISAHVAAQYLKVNGGEYNPAVYTVTIVGGDKLECPTIIEKVVAPTASDVCGTDKDAVTVGKGEGYTEEVKWNADRSEATVKAVESEGFQIAEGVKTEWTFKFTNVPCATDTPKPTASTPAAAAPAKAAPAAPAKASAPVDVLASTGSNTQDLAPIFWIGGFLLLSGIAALTIQQVRRNRKVAPVTTSDNE